MKKAHYCVVISFFYFLPICAMDTLLITRQRHKKHHTPILDAISINSKEQKEARRQILKSIMQTTSALERQRALNIYCDGFDINEYAHQQQQIKVIDKELAKLSISEPQTTTSMYIICPPAPPPSPSHDSEETIIPESPLDLPELLS